MYRPGSSTPPSSLAGWCVTEVRGVYRLRPVRPLLPRSANLPPFLGRVGRLPIPFRREVCWCATAQDCAGQLASPSLMGSRCSLLVRRVNHTGFDPVTVTPSFGRVGPRTSLLGWMRVTAQGYADRLALPGWGGSTVTTFPLHDGADPSSRIHWSTPPSLLAGSRLFPSRTTQTFLSASSLPHER